MAKLSRTDFLFLLSLFRASSSPSVADVPANRGSRDNMNAELHGRVEKPRSHLEKIRLLRNAATLVNEHNAMPTQIENFHQMPPSLPGISSFSREQEGEGQGDNEGSTYHSNFNWVPNSVPSFEGTGTEDENYDLKILKGHTSWIQDVRNELRLISKSNEEMLRVLQSMSAAQSKIGKEIIDLRLAVATIMETKATRPPQHVLSANVKLEHEDTPSSMSMKMTCRFPDCKSTCPVVNMWVLSLTVGSTGNTESKTGSPLGIHIVDRFKNTESKVSNFFPDKECIFKDVFLPVVQTVARKNDFWLEGEHFHQIFSNNHIAIVGEVEKKIRITRGTRKKDATSHFKSFKDPGGSTIQDLFGTVAAVSSKAYRRSTTSAIGNPRFVHAVRRTFRLKGDSPQVSLMQISFCCVAIIREFTTRSVESSLYKLVPAASGSRVSFKEQVDMHQLTIASLRKELDITASRTVTGWVTPDFIVVDGDRGDVEAIRLWAERLGDFSI